MNVIRVSGRAEDYLSGGQLWHRALLVDVGSTFTKVAVISPGGEFNGHAHARTTIDSNVVNGVHEAISLLPPEHRGSYDWAMLCSSAAGGLRMASIGLTHNLSGQAGTLAALGAGARVEAAEAGYLDQDAIDRIAAVSPHLLLLSGGIDGGDKEALLHNARLLTHLQTLPGIIVAGNSTVAHQAAEILGGQGRSVEVVDNVFPRPGTVSIAPTRDAVRELFMRHITRAKGLDQLMGLLLADCEPTPLAVSRSLWDMASDGEPLVMVDVGGATTDVHSVGGSEQGVRSVDLPMPDILRTVEGDIGMRWGAPGIVQAAGHVAAERWSMDPTTLSDSADHRRANPGYLPDSSLERQVDRALAEAAVSVALQRHAGRVVVRHNPWGDRYRVSGKDLRSCSRLIATGGVFRHMDDPLEVLRSALRSTDGALLPQAPRIEVDSDYRLYGVGLVARLHPNLAQALAMGLSAPVPP